MKSWQALQQYTQALEQPSKHLKHLIFEKNRLKNFSLDSSGLFFDFSRQRLDATVIKLLLDLALEKKLINRFNAIMDGEIVNFTEKRAALHTATRNLTTKAVKLEGRDVMPQIAAVRREIKNFTEDVRCGRITGSTGQAFQDVIVIGIGGSYLGTEFVSTALYWLAQQNIRLHFLANVDIHNFDMITKAIIPETALWVVVSKSYTTPETLANTALAQAFMRSKGLDPAKHFVTVTSQGSPGDDPANPVLKSFQMFDFIGGRYSVTSAVGGVPLSLYLGYDVFERFLQGCQQMDQHTRSAAPDKNGPLMAALISVWNNNCLGYPVQAIIPYAEPLRKLPAHIQQLYMESNGKSITNDGLPADQACAMIIFGEPGTNAQHSFFQLAHQGRAFPIDFIGVVKHHIKENHTLLYNGVSNHQELWANLISQPMALAIGKDDSDPHRSFPGNRPSSTILLNDLAPENIGRLLAFYEARTIYEALIWEINPFDQFGVELGKKLADGIREKIKNNNPGDDPFSKFYLKTLKFSIEEET